MKGRDLLILGAVLLVVGFALADTLRSDETSVETRPTTSAEQPTATTPERDQELGRALMPPVTGAPGSIVLTQTGSCAVREFDLPTGIELPNVVARSSCYLWAAPITAKVAVGIAEPLGAAVPFRFIDLGRRGRDLGTSQAASGFLIWSDDGQRAAWCNQNLEGTEQLLGGPRRRLDACPAAYRPDGRIFFARGDELYLGDRPVIRASGAITAVHYGSDGSIGLVVEGRRIERYVDDELTDAIDLPERFWDRVPVLSPDNCSAAFRSGDRIRIVDVGCSQSGFSSLILPGHAASWAPNGEWLVVAGPTTVAFYNLLTGAEPVTWPVGAVQIIWRRS